MTSNRSSMLFAWGMLCFIVPAWTGIAIAHTDPLWGKVLAAIVGSFATGVVLAFRDREVAR